MIHRSKSFFGHLLGLLFVGVGGCLFCALSSYSTDDPSWFTSIEGITQPCIVNFMGLPGSFSAAWLFSLFGSMSYAFVMALLWWGIALFRGDYGSFQGRSFAGLLLLFFAGLVWSAQHGVVCMGEARPGGFLGTWLASSLSATVDPFFAQGLVVVALLVGVFLSFGLLWIETWFKLAFSIGKRVGVAHCFSLLAGQGKKIFQMSGALCTRFLTGFSLPWGGLIEQCLTAVEPWFEEDDVLQGVAEWHIPVREKEPSTALFDSACLAYKLPTLPPSREGHGSKGREKQELAAVRARQLEEKLAFFGVTGRVTGITVGPVVTLFEYAPDEGVKVAKIVALEDDLSLALGALSLRIMAPIPGKSVVGFEVANGVRETVSFSALVHGEGFHCFDGALPLVMGRDVAGNDVIVDLAQMPHVLVAGSTGSGKSVALHAMLMSLLVSKTPEELKLLLVDPKRLEFAAYEGIPHLMAPVVTEITKVSRLLLHVTQQMDSRYSELARVGVRSIDDYHRQFGKEAMPYLVIVIDELADVMVTVGRDVEPLIARLAQMARAAGIHLVVATQRPSVDVITGIIKVNFPSRVAFKVMSKIDSRTILDAAGAELLLGKGDMLFLNAQGKMDRLQGAYVSTQEVTVVVDQIKAQRQAVYGLEEELLPILERAVDEADPLLPEVLSFVRSRQEVSVSLIQRRFRIGYNRSARLIDALEGQGIIMPAQGNKMRKVVEER